MEGKSISRKQNQNPVAAMINRHLIHEDPHNMVDLNPITPDNQTNLIVLPLSLHTVNPEVTKITSQKEVQVTHQKIVITTMVEEMEVTAEIPEGIKVSIEKEKIDSTVTHLPPTTQETTMTEDQDNIIMTI